MVRCTTVEREKAMLHGNAAHARIQRLEQDTARTELEVHEIRLQHAAVSTGGEGVLGRDLPFLPLQ